MPLAFILLTVRPGSEEKVVEELKKLPAVKRVFRICGPYDILAELEVEELSTLKEIVENRIRKIPENKSTLTMIALVS